MWWPWGRNLAEYSAMFKLSSTELEASILGCGDGPASFNAEMYGRAEQLSLPILFMPCRGQRLARQVGKHTRLSWNK